MRNRNFSGRQPRPRLEPFTLFVTLQHCPNSPSLFRPYQLDHTPRSSSAATCYLSCRPFSRPAPSSPFSACLRYAKHSSSRSCQSHFSVSFRRARRGYRASRGRLCQSFHTQAIYFCKPDMDHGRGRGGRMCWAAAKYLDVLSSSRSSASADYCSTKVRHQS